MASRSCANPKYTLTYLPSSGSFKTPKVAEKLKMRTRKVRVARGRPRECMRDSRLLRALSRLLFAAVAQTTLYSTNAIAEIGVAPPPIYDLYGEVGLLDMPSARIAPDGAMSATFSADHTDEHYNLGFQFLPWLETTFRYSRIDRYQLHNPASGQGDLYDRSLSLKIRLLKEDEYLPSVVIGSRDILGTGAYAGEYLAASKQFGPVDFTMGIGWRRLAGLAAFPNPLGLIFPSFKQGIGQTSTGTLALGNFFHGKTAGLFGGATWQTPVDGLALIVELSGDSYLVEQQVGSIKINSRVNVGFSYEPIRGLEIGAAYLYGSEAAMRVTFHMNAFDDPPTPRPWCSTAGSCDPSDGTAKSRGFGFASINNAFLR